MAQQEKEKPKEKSKDRYKLVRVTTQEAEMIQDTSDETILDEKKLLLEILNKLEKIEKAVA